MTTERRQTSRARPRWQLDFSGRPGGHTDLPAPPGFSSNNSALINADTSRCGETLFISFWFAWAFAIPNVCREADPALKIKRSWDLALGPFKQVPMNLFIMYMSGNSISIFPIMMVFMMMFR